MRFAPLVVTIAALAGCTGELGDASLGGAEGRADDTSPDDQTTDSAPADTAPPDSPPPPPEIASVGEGEDFFTVAFDDARTFARRYDADHPWGMDLVAKDGALSATIRDAVDPSFWMLYPGLGINPRTGAAKPIDAKKYSRVSYRMCVPVLRPGAQIRLYFFGGHTGEVDKISVSDALMLKSGCATYAFDLRAYPTWIGSVRGIRFDPTAMQNGDKFTIDWFRLTAPPDLKRYVEIEWSDLPAGDLELFADQDRSGEDGDLIARIPSAPTTGVHRWGASADEVLFPQDFQPGTYHVHASVNGKRVGYLPTPVVINRAPGVVVTAPSFASGPDYATAQGNPWDLTTSADAKVANAVSSTFGVNGLEAVSRDGDPQVTFDTPVPIDADEYRYFTIDVWSQYQFHSFQEERRDIGGMMRLLFYDDPACAGVTTDILIDVAKEWRTYSIDLKTAPMASNCAPWKGTRRTLRFDPNENTAGMDWSWKLRRAKLTAMPRGDATATIRWNLANAEASDSLTVSAHYDSDDVGFDGTLIDTKLAANGPGELTWKSASVPNGEYFVYLCAADRFNRICRYGDVPIRIRH